MLAKGDEEGALPVIGLEPTHEVAGVLGVPHHEVALGIGRRVGGDVLLVAKRSKRKGVVGVVTNLVLHATENTAPPGTCQHVGQVLGGVELKATLRQTQHAVLVRVRTGQEARPAGRAGGRHAKGVLEQQTVLGKRLHIGCVDRIAIGRDDASRVVRMQVQDVHGRSLGRGLSRTGMLGQQASVPEENYGKCSIDLLETIPVYCFDIISSRYMEYFPANGRQWGPSGRQTASFKSDGNHPPARSSQTAAV